MLYDTKNNSWYCTSDQEIVPSQVHCQMTFIVNTLKALQECMEHRRGRICEYSDTDRVQRQHPPKQGQKMEGMDQYILQSKKLSVGQQCNEAKKYYSGINIHRNEQTWP